MTAPAPGTGFAIQLGLAIGAVLVRRGVLDQADWDELFEGAMQAAIREAQRDGTICPGCAKLEAEKPSTVAFHDGRKTYQGSPEDRATWWTCKRCEFTGPNVGADTDGKRACLGSCGGVVPNETVPRAPSYWKNKATGK